MRMLKFIVTGQNIAKDPGCDFKHIVRGSKGYLGAQFRLDTEWKNCRVAASFWKYNKEYPVLLDRYGKCIIPDDAVTGDGFSVCLTGIRKNGAYKIVTNKIRVDQEG